MSMTAGAPQAAKDYANGFELKTNNSQTRITGSLPRNIHVRVAYAGPRQQYSCRLLAIDAVNQGEDLMIKLHQIIEGGAGRIFRFITACEDASLMRQDSVWVVSVSLLSSSAVVDLEEQIVDPIVYIKRSECSESLTHAFHHPAQLRSASNFVLDHLEGIVGDNRLVWTVPREALCLRKVFSRKAAFVWFCIALALSAGTGVGTGLAKRDLNLAFAGGTGMLAILAVIQCVLFWQISAASV